MGDSEVVGPGAESIGDIQNYLADFNPKDPVLHSKAEEMDTEVGGVALGSADASGSGQYFVDQVSSSSIFHPPSDGLV